MRYILSVRPELQRWFQIGDIMVGISIIRLIKEKNIPLRLEIMDESTPAKMSKSNVDLILDNFKKKYGCLKLELGSGVRPKPGYLHLDLMTDGEKPEVEFIYDVKDMPFEDEIFDEVIGIHLLEHIYWMAVPWVISECNRILKPGGTVVFEIPDLDAAMKRDKLKETGLFFDTIYMNCWGDWDWALREDFTVGFNHTSCWNEEMLTAMMESCGFSVVRDRQREAESVHKWVGVLTLVGTKTGKPIPFDEFNKKISVLSDKYKYSKLYKERYG